MSLTNGIPIKCQLFIGKMIITHPNLEVACFQTNPYIMVYDCFFWIKLESWAFTGILFLANNMIFGCFCSSFFSNQNEV